MTRCDIRVGTSGWSYEHWKGSIYPRELASRDMLSSYAERLSTAEINSSFYRLPTTKTLETWRDATPPRFVFSLKASRYITHMKKLKDPASSAAPFLKRVQVLGSKLGPILFQLPPRWSFDESRLAAFLDTLGRDGCRCAFEFRDRSWLNERALRLLAKHDAALCFYELAGFVSPLEPTSDLVYVRLHGPAEAYHGCYDQRALERWAERLVTWSVGGHNVFCYFDNDEAGYAARNAMQLQTILEDRGEWQPPPDGTPGPAGPTEIPDTEEPRGPADAPTEVPKGPDERPDEPPPEQA